MVNFIALLEAPQNGNGVFHRGLGHQHLLEPALKGGVFFNVAAVFIQGGGADAAQLSAGQHGLEQVAGIHGSASGASPHHGVDLVNEQHNLIFPRRDLLEHGLEAFLKLTAILGSSDQRTHVQGNETPVLQRRRHVAVDNALGQGFHNGGLAHTRLADQHGVVLCAA